MQRTWLDIALSLAPSREKLLPLTRLPEVDWFNALMSNATFKALLPVPILIAIAPAILWFFRGTWRRLDHEATEARLAARKQRPRYTWPLHFASRLRLQEKGGRWLAHTLARVRPAHDPDDVDFLGPKGANEAPMDYRPAVCFLIVAVVLTMQEYYGGRSFYEGTLAPTLEKLEAAGASWLRLKKYSELYGYGWWVLARVLGYVMVPVLTWRVLFPSDSILDMGLRLKGFVAHAWIYGLCLAVVVPLMFIVSRQPDFGTYYPFYKNSSRSWYDFLLWESMYWLQFFALEFFFRGWMVAVLRRTLGAAAIFAMALPYCMIHYGKPYLEAHGAIVAGVVLGSLSMRTRSIYAGFLLHVSVALGMDLLSLYKRAALPTVFWPPG